MLAYTTLSFPVRNISLMKTQLTQIGGKYLHIIKILKFVQIVFIRELSGYLSVRKALETHN